ncbi:MAG TPA: hypothetical protein ENK15_00830 [Thermopetrobacter sp.]|nr:hypothetical protein [Thermopetrobacter sp.]
MRAAPAGWYVRDFTTRGIPDAPLNERDFLTFLDEAETFLRKRQRAEYCGFVYLDDMQNPVFIKVFDPRKMGSACGCGGDVKPRWTISRMPPRPLPSEQAVAQAAKRRGGMLRRLLGGR